MEKPSELLNRHQAAERVRLKVATLDRFIRKGTGPTVVRFGSRVFIQERHLEEWIESRTVPPALKVVAL